MNDADTSGSSGGDASRIVDGFRKAGEAFLSMANIQRGEAHTWGIFLARHARRRKRNAHREHIARLVAEATRSEEAWGSHEAAGVARGNPPSPGGMLDKILESAVPTKAPPTGPDVPPPTQPGANS